MNQLAPNVAHTMFLETWGVFISSFFNSYVYPIGWFTEKFHFLSINKVVIGNRIKIDFILWFNDIKKK